MPSNKIEALLDLEAAAQADIDEFHDERQVQAAERIRNLLDFPEERDPRLFERLGASTEDSFADYFAIPYLERDPIWAASLSALTVAARMQAFIEYYGLEAIQMFQNNGRAINEFRKTMSKAELKEAALKGIGKARINGEKDRRRTGSNT